MVDGQQQIPDVERTRCICDPCPSYNECMRAESQLLFCMAGKSQTCTFEKKGCLCPSCPVTRDHSLTKSYYCIRGSQEEQIRTG